MQWWNCGRGVIKISEHQCRSVAAAYIVEWSRESWLSIEEMFFVTWRRDFPSNFLFNEKSRRLSPRRDSVSFQLQCLFIC